MQDDTMEMYEFVDLFSGKYYLSKSDYLKHDFARDGPLKTYTFDRNFEEYGGIWDKSTGIPANTSVSYAELFKYNVVYYDHVSDDKVPREEWEWNLWWVDDKGQDSMGKFDHPIHGFFKSTDTGKPCWMELDTREKWENFPNYGKIGFRGPAINVDVLKRADEKGDLPKVYWVEPKIQFESYRSGLEKANPYSVPISACHVCHT